MIFQLKNVLRNLLFLLKALKILDIQNILLPIEGFFYYTLIKMLFTDSVCLMI